MLRKKKFVLHFPILEMDVFCDGEVVYLSRSSQPTFKVLGMMVSGPPQSSRRGDAAGHGHAGHSRRGSFTNQEAIAAAVGKLQVYAAGTRMAAHEEAGMVLRRLREERGRINVEAEWKDGFTDKVTVAGECSEGKLSGYDSFFVFCLFFFCLFDCLLACLFVFPYAKVCYGS